MTNLRGQKRRLAQVLGIDTGASGPACPKRGYSTEEDAQRAIVKLGRTLRPYRWCGSWHLTSRLRAR